MGFFFSQRALQLQQVLLLHTIHHSFPQVYTNRVAWQSRKTQKGLICAAFSFRLGNSLRSYSKGHRESLQAMSRSTVQVRDTIELDETEVKIFERLLGTVNHYKLEGQLRVAGGWVRDKLLGKECKDIDIALEKMMGSEFVEKVRGYLLSIGEEAQGIAIIPSNPNQSKHLETARMRIFDIWVDFVNLRCEEYSDNSRIPTTQEFGTPEQDALRRDLTINSLFYNINTKSVEDWTNRGKEDLKLGKIVTPLPPKDTFMEDPLRVLRAIRFGARFEFMLDEQLKEAAACDEVKDALKTKISRERIGVEIDLMICGNQPVKAMTYIHDLKLFWVVFTLHPQCEPSEGCDSDCVTYLDSLWKLIRLVGCSTFTDGQRRLSLYAAMFLPLRKTIYKDKKGRGFPVVNHIFRDSLKLKVSDAEAVINIHHALEKFLSLLPHLSTGDVELDEVDLGSEYNDVPITSRESKLRVKTGLLLLEIKDFWRVALLMSTLLNHTDAFTDAVGDHLNNFKLSEKAIIDLGLDEVWNVKPLLNGKDIINVLQLKYGGPVVSKWQRKLVAWQLAHPSGTAEKCLEWMKKAQEKQLSEPNHKKCKTSDCINS